jgi:hypothetical protein
MLDKSFRFAFREKTYQSTLQQEEFNLVENYLSPRIHDWVSHNVWFQYFMLFIAILGTILGNSIMNELFLITGVVCAISFIINVVTSDIKIFWLTIKSFVFLSLTWNMLSIATTCHTGGSINLFSQSAMFSYFCAGYTAFTMDMTEVYSFKLKMIIFSIFSIYNFYLFIFILFLDTDDKSSCFFICTTSRAIRLGAIVNILIACVRTFYLKLQNPNYMTTISFHPKIHKVETRARGQELISTGNDKLDKMVEENLPIEIRSNSRHKRVSTKDMVAVNINKISVSSIMDNTTTLELKEIT